MKQIGLCLRCKRTFEREGNPKERVFFFNCNQHNEEK